LTQILCSCTSTILTGRYDRRRAPTRRHKLASKKHILAAEGHLAERFTTG